MITKDLNTEFWVISDTHLIADSLHDEGQAFSRMQKTSQGKRFVLPRNSIICFYEDGSTKEPCCYYRNR